MREEPALSCPICGLRVVGLMAALKEMRDVMAATMRVISRHDDYGRIAKDMSLEFESVGIQDGFGVRCQRAVDEASRQQRRPTR
jgi:hypothetical protein